ncbi:helix-turn-helix transcriptional regulator [Pseudanabaenaceae cyanobacterium LEGE 13415]|nr:helix-turn-helix transcriptional regulator [Pseudanabaenaceae cyanobacterium LEGE 13415]
MKRLEDSSVSIDFSCKQTCDFLLPQPAMLKSVDWEHLHFEHHHQPQFDTPEHESNWHVIAYCPPISCSVDSQMRSGERWLDGKLKQEARHDGDIAIIPAGIVQRCNWRMTSQFTIVAIDPTLLQQIGQDWLNRIELIPQYMTQQDALIQGIISALRAEVENSAIGEQLFVDSLRTALAIRLLRNYCTTKPKSLKNAKKLSQLNLQQITEYVHEHLDQEIKLTELAAIAQLSPYYFLRLFKQTTKVTPHQYILQCRIEQAKVLLQNSELSLAEIALRVGFCDQSHLTRCFKRLLGVTPKQIQQE